MMKNRWPRKSERKNKSSQSHLLRGAALQAALALVLFASLVNAPANAQAPSVAGSLTARAYPCNTQSPSSSPASTVLSSPATALRFNGRDYLVTRTFAYDEGTQAKMCFSLESPALPATEMKFIARDSWIGLTLFELPRAFARHAAPSSEESQGFFRTDRSDVQQIPVELSTRNSSRHFFSRSLHANEIRPLQNVDARFLQNAGAPIDDGAYGILSEQTVVVLPGQPAKVFRERDLSLLEITPFVYYRLAFEPADLATWISKVKSPTWTPDLLPIHFAASTAGTSQTKWLLRNELVITETCYSPKALSESSENYPVGGTLPLGGNKRPVGARGSEGDPRSGGVEPVGQGGLEDVLSDCRLTIETAQSSLAKNSPFAKLFADAFARPNSARLFLAYKRVGENLQIKSIANVHALLQLLEEGGWEYLTEHQDALEPILEPLAQQAKTALQMTIDFYRKYSGNPITMRRAFLFASLLQSRSYAKITTTALSDLIKELEVQLPLHLDTSNSRGAADRSEFAQDKTNLIRTFQSLLAEREKLP